MTDPENPDPDVALLAALRGGDEAAFTGVVRSLQPILRRLARSYVRREALVDEVLQDTWLAVLRGLGGFEGSSTFKTWVCRILINRAQTAGARDARSTPMSSLGAGDQAAAVDPERFREGGRWARPPAPWEDEDPARIASRNEILTVLGAALDELPERQRVVVLLRDVQGWTAEEVCNALDLAETNQRVLLHRGRARLREVLAAKLSMPGAPK